MYKILPILLLFTFILGQLHITPPPRNKPCISNENRLQMQFEIKNNREILINNNKLNRTPSHERVLFSQPLKSDDSYNAFNNYVIYYFVNQNPNDNNNPKDWNCGNRTYHNGCNNEYWCSHRGTDYTLSPYRWNMMENNNVQVVSVADGVILHKGDGYKDDNCNGNEEDAYLNNSITIEHYDGIVVSYHHLRKYSITNKNIGDTVYDGEYLGLVGSSGTSYYPHLHFEVWEDYVGGKSLDPFHGDCSQSNEESLWKEQEPYYNSQILKISTYSSFPDSNVTPWSICEPSIINQQSIFSPGDTIYIGAYHRDHFLNHVSEWGIYNPNGDLFHSWLDSLNSIDTNIWLDSLYIESWRIHDFILPSDISYLGSWEIKIIYEGKSYENYFSVIDTSIDLSNVINSQIINRYRIERAYPNPFNPITNITYGIPEYSNVQIIIFDLSGKQIASLINEF